MGKRGNGEGSIYQRADGRWCAAASLPGGGRRTVYGKTRREAAEKLAGIQQAIRESPRVAGSAVRMDAYLRDWLARHSLRLKHLTRDSYRRHIENDIIPAIGSIRLDELTPDAVQRMLDSLTARGLDGDTVIKVRGVLANALNAAIRAELVTRNVANIATAPRATPVRVDALTPDDAARVADAVRGTPAEGFALLALYAGLRRGEALGLHWRDVDLERAVLTVRFQLQRVNGEFVLSPPKTRSGTRVVPLIPQAVAALHDQKVRQDAKRAAAGERWRDHGLVFTHSDGSPIAGRVALARFTNALAAAGLPPMRFHDLRHGYATLLIQAGVNPRVVMELMGHSTIRVTMDLYAHVSDATARVATQALGDILGTATLQQRDGGPGPSADEGSDDSPGIAGL